MRGAWIEITAARGNWYPVTSLPVRGAWIEMSTCSRVIVFIPSLPVRGAWIEIYAVGKAAGLALVAPRAGSVD